MSSTLASAIIAIALCVSVTALAALCVFKAAQAYYLAKGEKAACIAYHRDHHIDWSQSK